MKISTTPFLCSFCLLPPTLTFWSKNGLPHLLHYITFIWVLWCLFPSTEMTFLDQRHIDSVRELNHEEVLYQHALNGRLDWIWMKIAALFPQLVFSSDHILPKWGKDSSWSPIDLRKLSQTNWDHWCLQLADLYTIS